MWLNRILLIASRRKREKMKENSMEKNDRREK
jgi:hypothetical protein